MQRAVRCTKLLCKLLRPSLTPCLPLVVFASYVDVVVPLVVFEVVVCANKLEANERALPVQKDLVARQKKKEG